ncbi:nicotinate-nucleotide adenylyltransferase [Roseofilum sp. SID2]|uniref:nicotinate-nucleotide adenylyltransferase n=1 Tax=Roseofilum sp. SID2 TaxID=2821498 RepID=UPI00298E3289|nr:nicotinate-nucleotide adenylyltransferase [Roseofilum sp. SID2]
MGEISNYPLPITHYQLPMLKTVALFGTSADPPTQGHRTILEWLSQHYDYVAVWASNNPFKNHQTPLDHRLAMLDLLIENLKDQYPNIGLYPQLGYSRSLESVTEARHLWPQERFILVVGSDLIAQMPKWYQIKTLLENVEVLIVPRSGYAIKSEQVQALVELGAEVAIADFDVPPVSSTAYRERKETQVITPPIQDYIHREQLYHAREPFKTNSQRAVS